MIKKTAKNVLVITAFLSLLSLGVLASKADFSGTWVLDKSKSEGLPPNFDQTMKVTQNEERIEVETKVKTSQGEQTGKDIYILNGKATDFTPPVLGANTAKNGKRISSLNADGNTLDVSEEALIEGPEGEFTLKVTRRWSLSADGKILTVEVSMDTPRGLQKSKRVFVKQ